MFVQKTRSLNSETLSEILFESSDFCRAMLCIGTAYAVVWCLSIRLSVSEKRSPRLVSTNSRTMNVGSESSKYDMMMRRTSACWHSRYVVAVTVLLTGDGCRSAVAVLTFSASEGVPCGAHHVTVAADYCRQ